MRRGAGGYLTVQAGETLTELSAGQEAVNYGTIITNNGTVTMNYGTIDINRGTVRTSETNGQILSNSNYVDVNFKLDPRTNRILMMGAMDNLVKGAAGQAVQNMNIALGLEETAGINFVPPAI